MKSFILQRWRLVCLFMLMIIGLIVLAVWDVPELGEEKYLGSSIGFLFLINLNIILVMVLGFLVVKNIVKLILDRRRGILGAKLQSRLVGAFIGLSLVPTVLLFFIARGIVDTVVQGWFSPQVTSAVEGSLSLARLHYETFENQMTRNASLLADYFTNVASRLIATENVSSGALVGVSERKALEVLLSEKANEYGLFNISIVGGDEYSGIVAQSTDSGQVTDIQQMPGFNLQSIKLAGSGNIVVRPEQYADGAFVRAYVPIRLRPIQGVLDNLERVEGLVNDKITLTSQPEFTLVVIASLWIQPEISQRLSQVIDAYDDYRELRTYRRPLASSYILTLVVVTLLVIFAAIWIGFYLARSLTVPVQLLAEGTGEVAHGNLQYRIPEVGDDELGILVRSFNKMTADLRHTTDELVSRRRYMETVLASVGVGVVSIDGDGVVATCNIAAREMLGIPAKVAVISRKLSEVLPNSISEKCNDLIEQLYSSQETVLSSTESLYVNNTTKHLQIKVTKLVGGEGAILGSVILVDDLTDLVSAQRMAAWQEVARRIAHEIKNPLTPIQLSAQRLLRWFKQGSSTKETPSVTLPSTDLSIIDESAQTIIGQVDILRTLVNEFSRFARMPKAQLAERDLNQVVSDAVKLFNQTHPNIKVVTKLSPDLPQCYMDADQILRVIGNLLDNAATGIEAKRERTYLDERDWEGEITIASESDLQLNCCRLFVSDNGVGISDRDKTKVFEPYFTTKKGGTGLGLAIVNSIVADHHGFIRVRDNFPEGAEFIVELPITDQSLRQVG